MAVTIVTHASVHSMCVRACVCVCVCVCVVLFVCGYKYMHILLFSVMTWRIYRKGLHIMYFNFKLNA